MGIAERKEREKEQRRNDIVDAAEAVFYEKGIDKATMDDVAERAELSKGTLYLYFKSKDELFHAIINRGMEILGNLFREAIKDGSCGAEKTMMIGKAFIRFNKEYPHYYDAFLRHGSMLICLDDATHTEMEGIPLKQKIMQVFVDVLTEGIIDGSIDKDLNPGKTAILLWAELSGVLQLLEYKGAIIEKFFNVEADELLDYFFEFTGRALKVE